MHVLGPLRRVRLLVQGLHDVHGARAEAAADGVHEYHDQVAVRGHVEDDLGERGGGEMILMLYSRRCSSRWCSSQGFSSQVSVLRWERWRDGEIWRDGRDGEMER